MTHSNLKLILSLAMTSLCANGITSARAAEPLNLTPAGSIEIPNSKGKFDFLRVDEKRHRLLAAHENDGTADYFDLDKQAMITRIKIGGSVDHAFDLESKFYYVSVQEDKRVAVVDAETLKEVKSIRTAGPTDAILYEPKNHLIYVTEDEGSNVFVIDPVAAKVVATVVIPGVPEFMIYDAAADRIYVNIKDKDLVAVIDPQSNKTVGQWATGVAKQPHGLALDVAKHRVYASGGNGMLVSIDTKTGSVTGAIEIAPKVDQIAFDSVGGLLYCAGADKMTVLKTSGANLVSLGDLSTAGTAKNVAVDPATRVVWTTYTDGKSSFAKSWLPPKL